MARIYKYKNIKNSVNHQSTEALIEQFNAQVGKRCWASARAAHDTALIDTLIDIEAWMYLLFMMVKVSPSRSMWCLMKT